MALRSLVARTRTAAVAAALRPQRVSPAAASRPLSTARIQQGRRTLDFESASLEDIKRESDLLSIKAAEALGRVRGYKHIVYPRIMQDFYRNTILYAGIVVPTELLSWAVHPDYNSTFRVRARW